MMVPFESAVRGSLEGSRGDRVHVPATCRADEHRNRATPLCGTQLPNLHVAFDLAVESGYMPRNPATRKIAPKVRKRKVKPYDEEEVRKLIDAALGQFGGVRWVIALALGLRQGEPSERSRRVHRVVRIDVCRLASVGLRRVVRPCPRAAGVLSVRRSFAGRGRCRRTPHRDLLRRSVQTGRPSRSPDSPPLLLPEPWTLAEYRPTCR